jgi:hypothetical protein
MTGDDAASLTALMSDYGGLWEISRTPKGVRAQQRHSPAPPLVFTAPTAATLREMLEHGYDPAELAAVIRDFGSAWQVEHINPGSAWIALSREDDGVIRVVAARDLGSLRGSLGRGPGEAHRRQAPPGPDTGQAGQ